MAAFNKSLGLDRPPVERYFEWVGGAVQGDFGKSFAGAGGWREENVRYVSDIIGPRLYNTFFLAAVTAIVAVPIALILGLLAALYRNSWFDRIVNSVTLTTIASPEFFVAYILMFFLAVKFRIFYPLSTVNAATPFAEHIARVALPALTLTLVIVAHMMRMTRASIISLLANPDVYKRQVVTSPSSHWPAVFRSARPIRCSSARPALKPNRAAISVPVSATATPPTPLILQPMPTA